MNYDQQKSWSYWLEDLKTLASLVMKWDQAATDVERRKWKTAIDLQMKNINWRTYSFPLKPLPKDYQTCVGKITKTQLLKKLKQIYE